MFITSNWSTVVSNDNTFQYCYTSDNPGGIFSLKKTHLTDVDSTFKYMGATKGGGIYVNKGDISLTDNRVLDSYAQYGGFIYMKGQSSLTITDMDVDDVFADKSGGFIHSDEDNCSTNEKIEFL
jgi:hypothetical protein